MKKTFLILCVFIIGSAVQAVPFVWNKIQKTGLQDNLVDEIQIEKDGDDAGDVIQDASDVIQNQIQSQVREEGNMLREEMKKLNDTSRQLEEKLLARISELEEEVEEKQVEDDLILQQLNQLSTSDNLGDEKIYSGDMLGQVGSDDDAWIIVDNDDALIMSPLFVDYFEDYLVLGDPVEITGDLETDGEIEYQ